MFKTNTLKLNTDSLFADPYKYTIQAKLVINYLRK